MIRLYALHFEQERRSSYTYFITEEGQPLIDPAYEFEITQQDYDVINQTVLQFPKSLVYTFMCGPEYRDVLLWKDETGQVLRIFNMCFSCWHFQLSDGADVEIIVDAEENDFYKVKTNTLRQFFRQTEMKLGYVRSEPHYLDEV